MNFPGGPFIRSLDMFDLVTNPHNVHLVFNHFREKQKGGQWKEGEAVHRTLALPILPFVPPSLIYFPACHPIHPPPSSPLYFHLAKKVAKRTRKATLFFYCFHYIFPLLSFDFANGQIPEYHDFEGRFSLRPKHWPKNHGGP